MCERTGCLCIEFTVGRRLERADRQQPDESPVEFLARVGCAVGDVLDGEEITEGGEVIEQGRTVRITAIGEQQVRGRRVHEGGLPDGPETSLTFDGRLWRPRQSALSPESDLDDAELAHDAHKSWALGELASRLETLDVNQWRRSLAFRGADADEVDEIEAAFNHRYYERRKADFFAVPPAFEEYDAVLFAGYATRNTLLRRMHLPAGSAQEARVWGAMQKMPHRAFIAIMWRDRLTKEQLHLLTRAAREAGISLADLL